MVPIFSLWVLLGVMTPITPHVDVGSSEIELALVPDHISVGASYHGTTVRVSADIPPCDGVAVVLEGDEEDVTLNRKGKVVGLWLNVASVTVHGAPRVYVVASSNELTDLCQTHQRLELGLGFDALAERIRFKSDKPLTGSEFEQFLRLMEYRGTYATGTPIEVKDVDAGHRRASTTLPIPSCVGPGGYSVSLYCFEGGELVGRATAGLSIEAVGLPRLMKRLAFGHPAVHGILAVVVALAAGATMGLIFNTRSRRRK